MATLNRILDVAQSVVEWLLALAFVISAAELVGQAPLTSHGPMSQIFGGHVALYVYMAWFAFLGVSLIYAKLGKRKRLHKNILMAIYLTTIYTSILTVTVLGFAWTSIIDDIVIGILAAVCWMRWKFKTEYISPRAFQKTVEQYRDDIP